MKEELIHFGVLGMKWGIRKKSSNNIIPGEFKPNKSDEFIFGRKGAQRIANNRNKGNSILDSSGKVITRYHDTVKKGYDVVNGLIG